MDACRSNPSSSSPEVVARMAIAGISTGFGARVHIQQPDRDSKHQYFVAFGANSGNPVEETDKHGWFTESILKCISEDEEIDQVFRRIGLDIYEQTQGRQRVWVHHCLLNPLYLNRKEPIDVK